LDAVIALHPMSDTDPNMLEHLAVVFACSRVDAKRLREWENKGL